jgi:hypothetical protein
MTDEQLAAIRARCSAVPDTKLIMLDSDNDLFDELAIHMVRDQLLVGEIAWLNKDDVSRAYGEIFAHARADIPALLAYIDELLAEVERLRAEVERLRDAEGILNMVRGLPLLTSDIVDTVALTYCKGLWDVCTISDPYWTGHFGIGGTPEGALRETLDYMLEACHD